MLFELTVTPSNKQEFEPFHVVKNVKEKFNVGADVTNVAALDKF